MSMVELEINIDKDLGFKDITILTVEDRTEPINKIITKHGKPARALSRKKSDVKNSELFLKFYKLIEDAIENPSADTQFLIDYIGDFYFNGGNKKKIIENFALSLVRNPILKNKFHNSESTIKEKGFDSFAFDTAQLYNSIKVELNDK